MQVWPASRTDTRKIAGIRVRLDLDRALRNEVVVMIAGNVVRIEYASDNLSYDDARELARQAVAAKEGWTVVIDLGGITETTTAALARLVALRRQLRKTGRELRIVCPHGRAKHLYDVWRLGELLPAATAMAV